MLHNHLLYYLQNDADLILLAFCVKIILIFFMTTVLNLKYQPGCLKVKIPNIHAIWVTMPCRFVNYVRSVEEASVLGVAIVEED